MLDFTNQYEARIVIKNRAVKEYPHTDGNIYVEGRKGSEYELEFINHSNERVLVVPAVDGLSVMDGEAAGLDSDGYIIDPKSTIKIPGWRLDNGSVAAFEFSKKKNGYAANTSDEAAENTGVIGFMVFREKITYQPMSNVYTTSNTLLGGGVRGFTSNELSPYKIGSFYSGNVDTMSFASTDIDGVAAEVDQKLGTAFGEEKEFQTIEMNFEKRDPRNPDAILVCYYDSARGLEKRGIKLSQRRSGPSAFPKYQGRHNSGCIPPQNWSGKRR